MMLAKDCAKYYMPLLSTFCKKLTDQRPAEDFRGIPHPFIPVWGTRYEQAIVKMAFIGEETRGWDPELPKYIGQVQNWESSFNININDFLKSKNLVDFLRSQNLDKFQKLDYVKYKWSGGSANRYTFWGFIMYFLAALYLIGENWVILKQQEPPKNILNSFLWGNATAIERWESEGISKEEADRKAHDIARKAADESNLNDFQHLQKIFSPDVSIIMCDPEDCKDFLSHTTKDSLWCKGKKFNGKELKVSLWKAGESLIFNMPHPVNLRWMYGKGAAEFCAETIRDGLWEYGLHPLQRFIDCDERAEGLDTFFSKCKSRAANTKEAVAFIATELRKQGATMTVRMLCNLLNKLGYRTAYGTEYEAGRGSYKMIASAWDYYQNYLKQQDTAEAIAKAFTKPDGSYAYLRD